MCRLLRAACAVLLFLPLLTGCADPPEVVLAPRLEVPPSLMTCTAEPEPPALLQDDSELAYWIVDLSDAGRDCRDHLARVRALVAGQAGAEVR